MLVDEAYGVRPPYGVLVLKGGISERVPFTPELERRVHEMMQEMRRILILKSEHRPGPRWVQSKCTPCGYRDVCWDQDASN
jgi:CRISPR/Cas system-associated exonuclease Cas4 (RecB family)